MLDSHLPPPFDSATLVAFEFPPCDGGVSRLCGALADGLRKAGVSVHLVTDARFGRRTPHSVDSIFTAGPGRIRREWSAVRHLRSQAKAGVAICGMWYPEGLIATLAGVRPRVLLAHGAELMPATSRLREPIWRRLRRQTCESADLIVANSEYTRRLIRSASPRAKVVAIPPGVDHDKFSPGDRAAAKARMGVAGRVAVSSVSRLQNFKGHRTVLRALAALPERARAHLTYLITGTGPAEDGLRRFAAELGISGQVRFLGFVADEDLPDIYRASDLFVLCTEEVTAHRSVEGFGLVFLEAQACGTPVVGTRTGGIPDAIPPGEGGWLIPQDDAAALTSILQRLIDEPESFRSAGLAARARVERECTWDQYMRRFIGALAENGIRFESPASARAK